MQDTFGVSSLGPQNFWLILDIFLLRPANYKCALNNLEMEDGGRHWREKIKSHTFKRFHM